MSERSLMESTGLAEPFWYIIIATGGTFIILSTTVLVFVLCRYQQDRADRGQAVSAYCANDVYPDKRSSGGPDLWCRQEIELLKNNQPLTFGNSSSSDQQIVPINMGFSAYPDGTATLPTRHRVNANRWAQEQRQQEPPNWSYSTIRKPAVPKANAYTLPPTSNTPEHKLDRNTELVQLTAGRDSSKATPKHHPTAGIVPPTNQRVSKGLVSGTTCTSSDSPPRDFANYAKSQPKDNLNSEYSSYSFKNSHQSSQPTNNVPSKRHYQTINYHHKNPSFTTEKDQSALGYVPDPAMHFSEGHWDAVPKDHLSGTFDKLTRASNHYSQTQKHYHTIDRSGTLSKKAQDMKYRTLQQNNLF
ncbi:Oidioi.mRNA.OKI2018_I69.chr2.g7219.t1.cds [Oikopleura dioica]|uniref:Oidioi.mRNA.OKI2018_I69.chr2.g7219.t1.cds n=1 Tax=Oikopleura dioica TaxID=34765 RepID=A0ABN7TBH9_OIKDI|nr:Oidioi.mRNA.OKI2018_I69.chr2.g7219.t1.cds [Oikopleura dioica]